MSSPFLVELSTIAIGHLIKPHEKHLFKNGISEAEALPILKQDASQAEKAVIRLINVLMNNNQFDVLLASPLTS